MGYRLEKSPRKVRDEYRGQDMSWVVTSNGKGEEKLEPSFQKTKTSCTSYVVKSAWK